MSENKQSEVTAGTPSPERLGSRTCKHCYRVSGNAGQSVKCVQRNEWVNASNKACDKFVGANTVRQVRRETNGGKE